MGKRKVPPDATDREGNRPKRGKRQLDLSKYRTRDGRRDPVVREMERRTGFRIPGSIRIVGRSVRVDVLHYDLRDMPEVPPDMTIEEGTADFSEGTITIRLFYLKDGKCLTNADNLAVTLCHEVVHWINEVSGFGDMPMEERFTKAASEAWYQLIPQIVKG